MKYPCPQCGNANEIVNQCRCDPKNLPTVPRPPTTIADLRANCPQGYNLAAIWPTGRAWDIDLFNQQASPVLKEAVGPLGVFRAMEVRMRGLLASLADEKREVTLLHLIFAEDGQTAILHSYTVIVHPGR